MKPPSHLDRRKKYWGKLDDFDPTFAKEVKERFERHQRQIELSGLKEATLARWRMYMSRDESGGYDMIQLAGKRGELLSVPFSEYRSLIADQLEMVTAKPLSFQAMAENDDADSIRGSLVSEGLIEHYSETKLEHLSTVWAEMALTQPGAWLSQSWNPLIGPDLPPATPEGAPDDYQHSPEDIDFAGDIDYRLHSIFDAAWPISGNLHEPEYITFKIRMLRHLLAETIGRQRGSEIREKILSAPDSKRNPFEEQAKSICDPELEEYIDVYVTYFARSPLLKAGRISWSLADAESVILSGPNPYYCIPATLLSTATTLGENTPYCSNFDLYALMQLQRKGYSTLASHLDASHQVIHSADSPSKFTYRNLGPFKLLHSPTPPTVLQMFNATKEMFAWPDVLRQVAQRLVKVSDAARGMSDASESGAKMRMEASISQGFHGGFIRRRNFALGHSTSITVKILSAHVDARRAVPIVGKRQKSEVLRFVGADLNPVQRIRVAVQDPATDTPEGKKAIADMALERGWIRFPDEYTLAMRTGNLDVAEGGIIDMGTTVRDDVEQLKDLQAPMPPILTMDDHRRAIAEAQKASYDKEIRGNPAIIRRLEQYAAEHAAFIDPGRPDRYIPSLMEALGQQPLQGAMQGMQGMLGQQGPQGGIQKDPNAPIRIPMQGGASQGGGSAPQANMPARPAQMNPGRPDPASTGGPPASTPIPPGR